MCRPEMQEVTNDSLKHLVFVYGTLKRGFANYTRYLGVAEASGKACFAGLAKTAEALPMVVRPPAPPRSSGAPQLMDNAGTGHRIAGEVFLVNDDALEALDLLEGVSTGRYYKREIAVSLDDDCGEVLCLAYFAKATEELLALPCFPAYTAEHNAAYCPKPVRQEILALCSDLAEANLALDDESVPREPLAVC